MSFFSNLTSYLTGNTSAQNLNTPSAVSVQNQAPVKPKKIKPVEKPLSEIALATKKIMPITVDHNRNYASMNLERVIINLEGTASRLTDAMGTKSKITVRLFDVDTVITKKSLGELKNAIEKMKQLKTGFDEIAQAKKSVLDNPDQEVSEFDKLKEVFAGETGVGVLKLAKDISAFLESKDWKSAKIFKNSNPNIIESYLRAFIEEARIMDGSILPETQKIALVHNFANERILAPQTDEMKKSLSYANALSTYDNYHHELTGIQEEFSISLVESAEEKGIKVQIKPNPHNGIDITMSRHDDDLYSVLMEWQTINEKMIPKYEDLGRSLNSETINYGLLEQHSKALKTATDQAKTLVKDIQNGLISEQERQQAKVQRQQAAQEAEKQQKRDAQTGKTHEERLAKDDAETKFLAIRDAKRAEEAAKLKASIPAPEALKPYQTDLFTWVQNPAHLRDDVSISNESNKYVCPLNTDRIRLYTQKKRGGRESLREHIQRRHPVAIPYLYKISDQAPQELKPAGLGNSLDDKVHYALSKIAFGDRTGIPEMATVSEPVWEFRGAGAGNDTRPSIRVKTDVEIEGTKYRFGTILAIPSNANQGITETEGTVKGLIMTGFEVTRLPTT